MKAVKAWLTISLFVGSFFLSLSEEQLTIYLFSEMFCGVWQRK